MAFEHWKLRRLSRYGLLATVVCFPWMLGGALPVTLPLLISVAGVCALLSTFAVSNVRLSQTAWLYLGVALVPVTVAVMQLIPLPGALLAMVSARAEEVRQFVLVPLDVDSMMPVSLEPLATFAALGRALALLLLVFAAQMALASKRGFSQLLWTLALSGTALAICGLVHWALGIETLFGWYQFQANNELMTPFGNRNHFAALLILTSTASLALSATSESLERRLIHAAGASVQGLAVFLSLSRGGIAVLVVVWLCAATLLVSSRKAERPAVRVLPWVVLAVTSLMVVAVAYEPLLQRWQTMDSVERLSATKLGQWPMFLLAAKHFFPLGMGLGAFEIGFSAFQTESFDVTFTHPENVVLQCLNEMGVVPTAVMGVLVIWFWLSSLRKHQRREVRLLLIGLAGVLVHELVDFALELNAVAPVVAISCGAVAGLTEHSRKKASTNAAQNQPRLLAFRLAIAAAVVLAWFSYLKSRPTFGDDEQLAANALRKPNEESTASVRDAMIRHPSSWVIASVAARQAKDPRNALAWVNRWLFLRPTDSRAHVTAASALFRLGRHSQAYEEIRSAFSLGDFTVLAQVIDIAKQRDDFRPLFVENPALIEVGADLLWNDIVWLERWLMQAADHAPSKVAQVRANILLVEHFLQRGKVKEAAERLAQLPVAEADVERTMLSVRTLSAQGRHDVAMKQIEPLLQKRPQDLKVGLLGVDTYEASGQPLKAQLVLDRLLPMVAASERAQIFSRKAHLLERQGDVRAALALWQQLSRLEPQSPAHHYQVARLYEQLGAKRSALDALNAGRAIDSVEGSAAQAEWHLRLSGAQR